MPRLGVEHQHRDVRAVDRRRACTTLTWSTFSLSRRTRRMPAVSTQPIAAAPAHEAAVDRVARRARHGRDHGPLAADEPVEQRRLPHVRASDEGDAHRRLRPRSTPRRAAGRSSAASSRSPTPCPCSAEIRLPVAQAETRELRRVLRPGLRPCSPTSMHLLAVAPQSRARSLRRPAAARRARPRRTARRRLLSIASSRLVRRGAEQRIVRAQQQAARVDHLERPALPFDLRVVAVARGAGPAVGDRLPPSADAVEQRGLTDVGPADEGDLGAAGSCSRGPGRV